MVLARRARRSSPRCSAAIEADLRPRDVVEDDRVDRLSIELRPRARATASAARASAAKPTSVCPARRSAPSAGEDVRRSARASGRGRTRPRGRSSPRPARRAGSRRGAAAISSTSAPANSVADGGGELGGRLDVDRPRRRPEAAGHVGGDQGHLGAAPRRRRSASARPMRPLERLPMKRTGSIGSRVPPAVTSTRSPSQAPIGGRQHRLDLGQQTGRVGQATESVFASRGEGPLLGLDHPHAASRAASRRFAWVAASAYMRSFIAGATSARRRAGEERGGQHRVGRSRPRASRSCSPRRARPDRRRRWRRPRGGRSGRARDRVAREGAAHRVALELVGQHRGADDRPRTRPRRRTACAAGVISTRTPWPARVASRASSSAL